METRRRFLKKALYITPVILTVKVRPARANSAYGSGSGGSSSSPTSSASSGGDSTAWWAFWR